MDKPIIKPLEVSDVDELFKEIRESDLRELEASGPGEPIDRVKLAAAQAIQTGIGFSVRDSAGKLILIFGAGKGAKESHGVIWLLGTRRVNRWAKQIILHAHEWIERIHDRFPILYNVSDIRNKTYSKWIERMGFNLYATHLKYGEAQIPFVEFGRFDLSKMAKFEEEFGYV